MKHGITQQDAPAQRAKKHAPLRAVWVSILHYRYAAPSHMRHTQVTRPPID
ncbi:MAG: hypothetical protein IPH37_03380 [Burkholderiales bacterium]|nr:hypothetical protein [Burkholderiales bacterium]MBK9346360.1 hypothetical protein [Burkholderiales bacterium]